tara:strand:+ start:254 stop:505 length:252 start_codon:yes stop_codon:yes gene_type:complete
VPLPNSGQISIKDIYNEAVGTGGQGNTPSSIHISAGLTEISNLVTSILYGYGGITSPADDPNNLNASTPHAFSEFYGVDYYGN